MSHDSRLLEFETDCSTDVTCWWEQSSYDYYLQTGFLDTTKEDHPLTGAAEAAAEAAAASSSSSDLPTSATSYDRFAFLCNLFDLASDDVDSVIYADDYDAFCDTNDLFPIIVKLLLADCELFECAAESCRHRAVVAIVNAFTMFVNSFQSATDYAHPNQVHGSHPLLSIAITDPATAEAWLEDRDALQRMLIEATSDAWRANALAASSSNADKLCDLKKTSMRTKHADHQLTEKLIRRHVPTLLPVRSGDFDWFEAMFDTTRRTVTLCVDWLKPSGYGKIFVESKIALLKCTKSTLFLQDVVERLSTMAMKRNFPSMSHDEQTDLFDVFLDVVLIKLMPSFRCRHSCATCAAVPATSECAFGGDWGWRGFDAGLENFVLSSVRLASTTFFVEHQEELRIAVQSNQTRFLLDLPDAILNETIVGTHILFPLTVLPIPTKFRDRNGVVGDYEGVFNTSRITMNSHFVKTSPFCVPPELYQFVTLKSEQAVDAPALGYCSDLVVLKRSNRAILDLCLVSKAWNDAFKRFLFAVGITTTNICEDENEVQKLPMFKNAPALPTLLKTRLATVNFTASRLAVTPSGNERLERIPICCLIPNQFSALKLNLITTDGNFSRAVQFSKRLQRHKQYFATHQLSAVSDTIATLSAKNDDTRQMLTPVLTAQELDLAPSCFKIELPATSFEAAKFCKQCTTTTTTDDNARNNRTKKKKSSSSSSHTFRPLCIEVKLGTLSQKGFKTVSVKRSTCFYVLTEMASRQQATAAKRRRRTQREKEERQAKQANNATTSDVAAVADVA